MAVGDGGHKPEVVRFRNAVLVAGILGFEPTPRERVPHRGAVHELDRAVEVIGSDSTGVPADLHLQTEKVIAARIVGRAKIEHAGAGKGGKVIGRHGRVPHHARVDGHGGAAGAGRPGSAGLTVRTDRAGLALRAGLAGGSGHAITRRAGRAHGAGRSDRASDDLRDEDWGSTEGLRVIAVIVGIAAAAHRDKGL